MAEAAESEGSEVALDNPDPLTNAISIHDFNVLDLDGNKVSLSKFSGNVTLVVNVASY